MSQGTISPGVDRGVHGPKNVIPRVESWITLGYALSLSTVAKEQQLFDDRIEAKGRKIKVFRPQGLVQ
jgi:hypothetical protein